MSTIYAIPIICDGCADAVPSNLVIDEKEDFLFFCDDCTPSNQEELKADDATIEEYERSMSHAQRTERSDIPT